MQQIDFHYNVPNRLRYACLVAKTVYSRQLKLAVWSSDAQRLSDFDSCLWQLDAMSFVPHVDATSEFAARTPVIFSTDLSKLSGDVLLLLDDHIPASWQTDFERFDRIIDVVSTDPAELQCSRARFVQYRNSGVKLVAHDRQQ